MIIVIVVCLAVVLVLGLVAEILWCFSFYINLETIILTVVYVAVVLGLGLRILYGFSRDIGRVLVTWILYSFAIIIVSIVGMVGVLGSDW